jgi:hypothetical protein
MPRITLEQLYFGKDDAESDFGKGGLLKQGFLRTSAYEAALEGQKSLIIGRKGSGKSAICLMLHNVLSGNGRGSLVTPDEISADEIRRFHLSGIPLEQSKQLIWRYVFAVQYAKYLLTVAKSSKRQEQPDSVSAVRRFLVDNHEVDDLTIRERFWKVVERLKGSVSLEAFGASIGAEVENAAPGIRVEDQIQHLEKKLRAAASDLGITEQSSSFHLLVDQIEKVWSDDRESDAMVVGLLQAAKEVQMRLGAVLCTVFLRTDIYERLQFADRDKLRGEEFHIDWDGPRLLELILTRARASSGEMITAKDLWREGAQGDGVFPTHIGDQDIESFVVSRTLMRPRDIIQLCNACRDTAKTNGQRDRIQERDVEHALAVYSNWKLSDLQNEWAINYPFLADVFILLSHSSCIISRRSFEARLTQVKSDLESRYPNLGTALSPTTLLSILYSIGLLGVIRNGETVYSYQEKVERGIRAADTQFVLHPCFRHALQSVSAMNLKPFVPIDDEPDIEELRSKVRTEYRHEQSPQLRGARSVRYFQYTRYSLERLLEGLNEASLPSEINDELRANVRAMFTDINRTSEDENPARVVETSARIARHLREMGRRVREQEWGSSVNTLLLLLTEAQEETELFLRRGGLREYS